MLLSKKTHLPKCWVFNVQVNTCVKHKYVTCYALEIFPGCQHQENAYGTAFRSNDNTTFTAQCNDGFKVFNISYKCVNDLVQNLEYCPMLGQLFVMTLTLCFFFQVINYSLFSANKHQNKNLLLDFDSNSPFLLCVSKFVTIYICG